MTMIFIGLSLIGVDVFIFSSFSSNVRLVNSDSDFKHDVDEDEEDDVEDEESP